MYIPEVSFLEEGYEFIPETVEGKAALNSELLAVKKIQCQDATQAIVDIIICSATDNITSDYHILK